MVKPQFSLGELEQKVKGTRQFTDREKPSDSFWKAIDFKAENKEKQIVLNFYGVGGIGKSRLREELEHLLHNNTELHHCTLNFETKKYREQGAALIQLCTELRKVAGIKFKNFALAYGIYWKKVQPLVPLNEGSGLTSIFDEGDFITDLIAAIEDAPGIGWIGKSIKFVSSTWNKYLKDWWNKSGNKIAETLDKKTEEEIAKYLPWCFAQDIKEYYKLSSTPIVIFIDTYEALWEVNRETGSFHKRDAWIRELIAHLPEVIWVILGREKLNWEDVDPDWKEILDQHYLDNLSKNDMKSFLESCDITDDSVQNYIMKSSLGVPFYLDLAVDIYNEVIPKRLLTQDDFPVNDERLRERFLRYLNINEKETLKMLAVSRYWDLPLFKKLVAEFHTQYPVSAYDNLFRFSFIAAVPNKPNTWSMHNLMREVLINEFKSKSPELYNNAHRIVFEHFNEQLRSSERMDNFDLFIEAFYFGKKALSITEFNAWQNEIFSRLFPANDKRVYIPRERELAQILDIIDREGKVIVNVFGPGGIGKTTFAYECLDALKNKDYLITMVNFYSLNDSNPINLLHSIANHLKKDYGANFNNYFESLDKTTKSKDAIHSIKVEDDLLSIWVNELKSFVSEHQGKLIIHIDSFDLIDKEGMEFLSDIIKELSKVSWILSGREMVSGLEEEGLYQIELRGFSEMEMKNYFISLGSLGGGFVLQRIMDTIEDIVQTLNVPRTGLIFQLVLKFYFDSLAEYGQEPDGNEMMAAMDRYTR